MNRCRPLFSLLAILGLGLLATAAIGKSPEASGAKKLPFQVNLAPGDALVHDGQRIENQTDQYESHVMQVGDEVIGQGGKHRSVILTGDANAVEVLNGSTLIARDSETEPCLELRKGSARIGRSSAGDGRSSSLRIMRENGDVVVKQGDFVVGQGDVALSESNKEYLYASEQPDFSSIRPAVSPSRPHVEPRQWQVEEPTVAASHPVKTVKQIRTRHRYAHKGHNRKARRGRVNVSKPSNMMPAPSVTITVHRVSMRDSSSAILQSWSTQPSWPSALRSQAAESRLVSSHPLQPAQISPDGSATWDPETKAVTFRTI
jgi:hypothetical protein